MARRPAVALFAAQLAIAFAAQAGDAVSLRLGGGEVALSDGVRARLAELARETFASCGPNTRQHPHNFGASALLAGMRQQRTLDASRLRVTFEPPFETVSALGGRLKVTEAILGLGREELFVGPTFTSDGRGVVEHLNCQYLPALEIACLPALAPYLPARYASVCALLERGADGRIVMPPPDIAPSCS